MVCVCVCVRVRVCVHVRACACVCAYVRTFKIDGSRMQLCVRSWYTYLFFRLTGMSPFLGDDDTETITNIAAGEFEYPDPDPEEGYEDITVLAKDFIDNLLKLKPK